MSMAIQRFYTILGNDTEPGRFGSQEAHVIACASSMLVLSSMIDTKVLSLGESLGQYTGETKLKIGYRDRNVEYNQLNTFKM